MRRHWALLLLGAYALLLAACGEEADRFEATVDADRDAREKMSASLNLMRDAELLEAEGLGENAAAKRQAAVESYLAAVDLWSRAVAGFEELLASNPDNARYQNHMANLIYNKYVSGLEADIERAERLFKSAAEADGNTLYQRNLALFAELSSRKETRELVEENMELVGELRRLSQEQ